MQAYGGSYSSVTSSGSIRYEFGVMRFLCNETAMSDGFESRFWHRLFQDVFMRATYPLRYVYLRWSRVYLAIKTVETAPVLV